MNEKLASNQFINNQKQLREETGRLTTETVERVWGDMEQFPRLLERYVKGGVLTLPEAVHKLTAQPAERFRLTGKGRIEPGADGDLPV
jgi:N-acyl-D-aspartate/D-glutamate deacylase